MNPSEMGEEAIGRVFRMELGIGMKLLEAKANLRGL